MTELKNLNDLENNLPPSTRHGIFENIKAEAIIWVKELPHLITKEDWFNFFNITEEDLKCLKYK